MSWCRVVWTNHYAMHLHLQLHTLISMLLVNCTVQMLIRFQTWHGSSHLRNYLHFCFLLLCMTLLIASFQRGVLFNNLDLLSALISFPIAGRSSLNRKWHRSMTGAHTSLYDRFKSWCNWNIRCDWKNVMWRSTSSRDVGLYIQHSRCCLDIAMWWHHSTTMLHRMASLWKWHHR